MSSAAKAKEPAKEPIAVRFGNRLRAVRKKHGLSQVAMAHQFGIDRGNISEIETAKVCPGLPLIESLADGFEMTISELMKGV